ncbi:glucosamine-6-phosphate deaminase [Paenibacillus lycopersici]|uniref:Glucosamine-6-phosphate deaminase n=1 Tax=Paenibacillus lycopersici TaxID=2704462 RepID=A0A6C0G4J7_9BACL|nr:6-phosphogluconolactonase [Paenibacillus lycopersici]QHT63552.1 glucosamine-6-phosphate deaminase [Paenibacillus lycopersici]
MIRIFETEAELARAIADEMLRNLTHEADPVFCLASGSTPQKSYREFADAVDPAGPIKSLRIVSLDEWVGIGRGSEGSCFQMMNADLFSLLPLDESRIVFYDGTKADLKAECERIDRFIERHPITFSLMGVGMNGHIGLNEPGCPVLNNSSVVELAETTRVVGQKYFKAGAKLEQGITLGLGQISASKRVVVAITGEHKAAIVREIFGNPQAKLPAQELLGFEHIDFFLDGAAAKYLDGNKN